MKRKDGEHLGKVLNIADRIIPPTKIRWQIIVEETPKVRIGFYKANNYDAHVFVTIPNWKLLEPAKQEALRELKKHGIAELDQTIIEHLPYILRKEGKTL